MNTLSTCFDRDMLQQSMVATWVMLKVCMHGYFNLIHSNDKCHVDYI